MCTRAVLETTPISSNVSAQRSMEPPPPTEAAGVIAPAVDVLVAPVGGVVAVVDFVVPDVEVLVPAVEVVVPVVGGGSEGAAGAG